MTDEQLQQMVQQLMKIQDNPQMIHVLKDSVDSYIKLQYVGTFVGFSIILGIILLLVFAVIKLTKDN
jgi:hypothetical protein